MNIIYRITEEIDKVIQTSSDDITASVKVASEIMNTDLSYKEKEFLINFSKKVEDFKSPAIKSIHSPEVNNAIWSVICWQ